MTFSKNVVFFLSEKTDQNASDNFNEAVLTGSVGFVVDVTGYVLRITQRGLFALCDQLLQIS